MDCANDPKGKVGTCQKSFIQSIKKDKIESQKDVQVFYPTDPSFKNGIRKPKAEEYYRKSCYVFVPHIQFPSIFLALKCDQCGAACLKPKEWQSNPCGRFIHDINTSLYLVSYLYTGNLYSLRIHFFLLRKM
jgi:hypothetical protein